MKTRYNGRLSILFFALALVLLLLAQQTVDAGDHNYTANPWCGRNF